MVRYELEVMVREEIKMGGFDWMEVHCGPHKFTNDVEREHAFLDWMWVWEQSILRTTIGTTYKT